MDLAGDPGTTEADANCFAQPSWYEIEVQGRKLLGSAQVRRSGVLLQHGALPLSLDYELWAQAFGAADIPAYVDGMRRRAIGLDEAGINDDRDMLQELKLVLRAHRVPGMVEADVPTMSQVLRMATADAQQGLRLVRRNATAWRIDPVRVDPARARELPEELAATA